MKNLNSNKIICDKCNYNHRDVTSFCSKCGACLYINSEQIKDEYIYPLFRCTKCNQINFWD